MPAKPALDDDGRYADRQLERAVSTVLTRGYWTTPPPDTDPDPPKQCRMTREQWESFTPGMRRAITREFTVREVWS